MTHRIVIIGAAGFGREVLDLITAMNSTPRVPRRDSLGFVDDGSADLALLGRRGTRHLGGIEVMRDHPGADFVIAIAPAQDRRRVDERTRQSVHAAATASGNVALPDGVVIGTNAPVIQGLGVATGTTVGAGAAAVRDPPAGVTAAGVPAHPITAP